jgi:hypothetical protein
MRKQKQSRQDDNECGRYLLANKLYCIRANVADICWQITCTVSELMWQIFAGK